RRYRQSSAATLWDLSRVELAVSAPTPLPAGWDTASGEDRPPSDSSSPKCPVCRVSGSSPDSAIRFSYLRDCVQRPPSTIARATFSTTRGFDLKNFREVTSPADWNGTFSLARSRSTLYPWLVAT